jgi:hypothetical protein
MNDELSKKYASELLKNDVFEFLHEPYTSYENIACAIAFKSKSGIFVTFIQDRGIETSCRVGPDDYAGTFLEDVLFAIDVKMPEYHDDFLELMQVASKLIIENLSKIEQAFDKDHIEETNRLTTIAARKRWGKWGDRFIKD